MADHKNTHNDAGNPRDDGDIQTKDRVHKNESQSVQGRDHSAGYVPGQTASQGQGQENVAQAGIEGTFDGTPEEEQEGQKVNVEQSNQAKTAQYKGKPGVKAPSPGQEQGTAWSQDMELSNSDVPARNPNSY